MSTNTQVDREVLHTVQVRDPNGHRTVFLEGLKSSTPISVIRDRAMSELRLTAEVDWNVRQDGTGSLLQEDQQLGEIANHQDQVTLTMQPDAGLG